MLGRDLAAATLRQRFPEARVIVRDMMQLSPDEQMHELARTSVLITTAGSASFRLVYLPDGAAVVLVGAPEVRVNLRLTSSLRKAFEVMLPMQIPAHVPRSTGHLRDCPFAGADVRYMVADTGLADAH